MSRIAVATLLEPTMDRLTYGSGRLVLDLALQPCADGSSLAVDGALVDRGRGGIDRVPAYLLAGTEIVDEAMTDAWGSFHLATVAREELRLCLLLEDDRIVELELARQTSPDLHWAMRPTSRSS